MAIIQRPLKGSRISSFYPVKSLPPLAALDSAFQLQEYISLLIRTDVHDVETIVSIPGKQHSVEREGSDGAEEKDGERDSKAEVTVDESCWIYEQLRRLAQDLTHPLITTLQQECTRSTCPQMKAGEWLYLCVAHGNDGAMEQCCAIDYILHTLDSATALLNSPRAFPSRLSIPPTSTRHFASLARRLGPFEQAEAESSLYARFLALTSKFNLVPSEFLEREEPRGRELHNAEPQPQELGRWTLGDSSSIVDLSGDISGTASPRKMGRSRTDTMVYSEAASVAEELARNDFSEAELDRAIAAERMLSADPQSTLDTLDGPVSETELQPVHAPSPPAPEEPTPAIEIHEEPPPAPLEEAEVLLDIAAPAPAEPAIPSDILEVEEDIAFLPPLESKSELPADEPEPAADSAPEDPAEEEQDADPAPEEEEEDATVEPEEVVPAEPEEEVQPAQEEVAEEPKLEESSAEPETPAEDEKDEEDIPAKDQDVAEAAVEQDEPVEESAEVISEEKEHVPEAPVDEPAS
ncbi:Mob1/phocein [Trametopsis cervina]|nr:Mob1/phocein [Trametopsis cervina]